MCVTSYLPGKTRRFACPSPPDGVDPIGIKWHRNVLQRKLSVNEAFALDKIVSLTKPQENGISQRDMWSTRFKNDNRRNPC
jgi:hypothetical protein